MPFPLRMADTEGMGLDPLFGLISSEHHPNKNVYQLNSEIVFFGLVTADIPETNSRKGFFWSGFPFLTRFQIFTGFILVKPKRSEVVVRKRFPSDRAWSWQRGRVSKKNRTHMSHQGGWHQRIANYRLTHSKAKCFRSGDALPDFNEFSKLFFRPVRISVRMVHCFNLKIRVVQTVVLGNGGSDPCQKQGILTKTATMTSLHSSGVATANQTKGRPVHELFPGASWNKSSMWIALVFPRKNTRIHKNGRNSWTFRIGPFFGLVCRGHSRIL